MRKLVSALLFLPLFVSAAEIEFTMLGANWSNPVGGNILSNNPSPPATAPNASISWGATGQTPSGYDFASRATPFTEMQDDLFSLGDFTHRNQPITSGTAIDSVVLSIFGDLTFTDDNNVSTDYIDVLFQYVFTHDETPNNANPCAYDESDGFANPAVGVNANGCADRVVINATDNSFITPEGLTLNVLGFAGSVGDAESGIFRDAFISGEAANNSALLVAQFSTPGDIDRVPVPATAFLFGIGFAGLVAARRRWNA